MKVRVKTIRQLYEELLTEHIRALLALKKSKMQHKRMDLRRFYDATVELQEELRFEIQAATTLDEVDFRKFKALAAAMELQEYLANRIALSDGAGLMDPDEEMQEELIYGYTIDEWNSLSEDEQIQIQDRFEYDMQHPDQKDWDVPY